MSLRMRASNADIGKRTSSSALPIGKGAPLLPPRPETENPANTKEDAGGVFVLSPRPGWRRLPHLDAKCAGERVCSTLARFFSNGAGFRWRRWLRNHRTVQA